jgi:hypothetical protein
MDPLLTTSDNPVEYDLAGEPCSERLDDLREVAGERALLARQQPRPPVGDGRDGASS